jgi:hypothetical protein
MDVKLGKDVMCYDPGVAQRSVLEKIYRDRIDSVENTHLRVCVMENTPF